jgi:hypothetical protein
MPDTRRPSSKYNSRNNPQAQTVIRSKRWSRYWARWNQKAITVVQL